MALIEVRGVADDGWLYNSHDIIAFETKNSWILVRPETLLTMCRDLLYMNMSIIQYKHNINYIKDLTEMMLLL